MRSRPKHVHQPATRQNPQFSSSHCLGHCEGVASQQIDVALMEEGRQARNIFIARKP